MCLRCRIGPLAFSVMTSAWAVVAAALGASFLTSLGSLGVVWYQDRRRGKAGDQDALHSAVLELLTRSIAAALRAQALRDTLRFRSGLMEGVDVVILRLRKPADPMEVLDWQQDLVPLNAALNEIWTRWDQEGIRLANDLVGKCADLLGTCVALAPPNTLRQRLGKVVIGERWTPATEKAYERARTDMVDARKRLADYARTTLKMDAVDVFAQVKGPEDQGTKHSPADTSG
jgi:hypothetical protein